MHVEVLPLLVCCVSIVFYFAILVWYLVSLNKMKKNLKEGEKLPGPQKQFWGVIVVSAILLVLPLLVPLALYLIVVVCGCSLLGEVIAMKERLENLQKKED